MEPSVNGEPPIQVVAQNIEMLEAMEARLAVAPRFLLAYEQELISFVSCLPYPAWIKDYNTRMIYVNPAYEKAYNITVEEYNGKLDFEVWHNDHSGEYKTNDMQVMQTREHVKLNETYEDVNGKTHTLRVLKWPLTHNNTVIGVAGMVIEDGTHNSLT